MTNSNSPRSLRMSRCWPMTVLSLTISNQSHSRGYGTPCLKSTCESWHMRAVWQAWVLAFRCQVKILDAHWHLTIKATIDSSLRPSKRLRLLYPTWLYLNQKGNRFAERWETMISRNLINEHLSLCVRLWSQTNTHTLICSNKSRNLPTRTFWSLKRNGWLA